MANHTERNVARGARRSRAAVPGRLARGLLALPLALTLAGTAPAAAAPAAPGNPRHGEALFVGSARLAAGGAPCLGCHGIAGHGLERAASFGPDLSSAHQQYGAEGLDGLLEDVVFPSMAPLYRGHAVTPAERADLVAFLAEASGAPPAALGGGFAAGVAGAAVAFLGLVVVIGRRGGARGHAAGAGRTP
jgi:mono/diheme cytochrome c family protein